MQAKGEVEFHIQSLHALAFTILEHYISLSKSAWTLRAQNRWQTPPLTIDTKPPIFVREDVVVHVTREINI